MHRQRHREIASTGVINQYQTLSSQPASVMLYLRLSGGIAVVIGRHQEELRAGINVSGANNLSVNNISTSSSAIHSK